MSQSKTQAREAQKSDALELPLEADESSKQYTGDRRAHTDAAGIRRKFGIPSWDADVFEDYRKHVYPNMLTHVWEGEPQGVSRDKGGTDMLATGKPGSGKSTWMLYLSARLMEINKEIVVWRASSSRSEWLPFAPWARVCLPKHADIETRLEPKDRRKETIKGVDVKDVAREVVYYETPRQLNRELLEPGMFHVVYPDPSMHGCQELYESVQSKEFENLEFNSDNPSKHWWFAWMLARVEFGPFHWTSIMFDEIGDIAPQSAQKDEHATYQKVQLLKEAYADARKTGLSMFAAGHSEVDIHDSVRRKMRWRVQMPGGANPTRKTDVVGFDSIPMETDLTGSSKPGEPLVYNERNFELLNYSHIPSPIDRKLKISLSEGGQA